MHRGPALLCLQWITPRQLCVMITQSKEEGQWFSAQEGLFLTSIYSA